ncbi:hypothetical protein SAFG77S_03195 [Streptomyces afghaniensis]
MTEASAEATSAGEATSEADSDATGGADLAPLPGQAGCLSRGQCSAASRPRLRSRCCRARPGRRQARLWPASSAPALRPPGFQRTGRFRAQAPRAAARSRPGRRQPRPWSPSSAPGTPGRGSAPGRLGPGPAHAPEVSARPLPAPAPAPPAATQPRPSRPPVRSGPR